MFEFVTGSFYGIALSNWLTSVVILLAALVIGKIIYTIVKKILPILTAKTKTDLDDLFIETIQGPVLLVFASAGLYFGFLSLQVTNQEMIALFSRAFFFLNIMNLAWFLTRFTDRFMMRFFQSIAKRTDRETINQVAPLFVKTFKITIWIIAVLIAVDNLGFDITAVLAGAGIVGIAIAFAAQETIANIFGGVALIMDKSIRRGDRIQLDTGEVGIVDEITLRSTRIKTFNNEVIIIPNSVFTKSKFTNFNVPDKSLRFNVFFSVAYGSNIDKVEKVVKNALEKIPGVSKEHPIEIRMDAMSDFSLNFKAFYWMKNFETDDAWPPVARKAVYQALEKNNIKIPFPTREIIFEKSSKKKGFK